MSSESTNGVTTKPDQRYRLSLVIPAWNEATCILQAIEEASAALSALTTEYEILVVDDGSSDGTAELVAQRAASDGHLRLIRHPVNRGYAAALRSGFAAAQYALVAFTDADCQFDLFNLEYLLPLTRHYDIVCGARLQRQDPPLRLFYSWGYNTLVKLLLGSPVHDLDCALKIFRRQRLAEIWPQSDGYFVNTEMLTRARAQGVSIVEVGVRHRPRCAGASKVSLFAVPQTLARLLPFWWTQSLFPGRTEQAPSAPAAAWLGGLLLAIIAGLQLFLHLEYRLFEPDEGRYAEIGREMLEHQQWIVPTLHNRPYFDKPPMFYWALAGSFQCFGTTAWAARLVPATAAWLTILATYIFGARVVGFRAAWIAGLAMTLAVGMVYVSRFVILDGLLTLWLTLALFCGLEALRGNPVRWRWWLASALFCALGFLTKGPVALALTIVPLLAYPWLNRQRLLQPAHWLAYLGLIVALVAPWFLTIIMACPEFARHFFWEHHLQRFVGGLNHPQPFWFYLPVLLLGGAPGTVLVWPWLRYQFSRDPQVMALRAPMHGFYFLWGAWCLAFFSLAACKLPSYILPAAPALALLLGVFCDHFLVRRTLTALLPDAWHKLPLYTSMAFCTAAMIALGVAWLANIETFAEWAAESAVWGAMLMALVLAGSKLSPRIAWSICCLVVFGFGYESSHDLAPAWAESRSPLPRDVRLLKLFADPQTAVVVVGRDWGSVPFYLGRQQVFSFDEPSETLKTKLRRFGRTLFVTRRGISAETLSTKVPDHSRIVRLADSGRATIWMTQPDQTAGQGTPAVLRSGRRL